MILDSFRCTANDLLELTDWNMLLRLTGDPDKPNTWHPVQTIKDHFGDIDGLITVVFADGTPETVFNASDLVEFAVARPGRSDDDLDVMNTLF
jgi:hypothetical protein